MTVLKILLIAAIATTLTCMYKSAKADMGGIVYVDAGRWDGTGFAISADGYILTDQHVVTDNVLVNIYYHGIKYPGVIVYKDKEKDLALISIPESTMMDFYAFEQSENQNYKVGGFPSDPKNAVTKGKTGYSYGKYLELLDGKICEGHSGAPVINIKTNRVMGIVQGTYLDALRDGKKSECGSSGSVAINTATIVQFLDEAGVKLNTWKVN